MPRVVWIVKMRSYRVAALYIRCRVTWWPKLHSSLLQIAYTSRCLLWIIFLGKWIAKGRLFYFSLLKHQHGFMMKWLQNGFTQLIMNVKRLGSSNTFTRNWEWTRTDSRPTFGCLYHPLNMFLYFWNKCECLWSLHFFRFYKQCCKRRCTIWFFASKEQEVGHTWCFYI